MSDSMSNRVLQAQIAQVRAMKARGSKAEDILQMDPHLADAVHEVYEESRTDVTSGVDAGSDLHSIAAEQIARYVAQRGAGSGSAASPFQQGEEVAA